MEVQQIMIKKLLERKEELTEQYIAVCKLIELHYKRENEKICKKCSDKNINIFKCFKCDKIVEKICYCSNVYNTYEEYEFKDQMFFICYDCLDTLKNAVEKT